MYSVAEGVAAEADAELLDGATEDELPLEASAAEDEPDAPADAALVPPGPAEDAALLIAKAALLEALPAPAPWVVLERPEPATLRGTLLARLLTPALWLALKYAELTILGDAVLATGDEERPGRPALEDDTGDGSTAMEVAEEAEEGLLPAGLEFTLPDDVRATAFELTALGEDGGPAIEVPALGDESGLGLVVVVGLEAVLEVVALEGLGALVTGDIPFEVGMLENMPEVGVLEAGAGLVIELD